MRRVPSVVMCALAVAASAPAAHGQPSSDTARTRAYDLAYNLDHDEAIATIERSIAAAPADPSNHRALASFLWQKMLFARGTVTVDDYLGKITKPTLSLKPPPPGLAKRFREEAERAIALAEKRVAANPRDASAQYEIGASIGLLASYSATIEGKVLAAFNAARRAYNAHETVLALAPQRKDAGLVVGTYRYIVAVLSLPMRWVAYAVGFGGGRERGIRMVEEAAAYPSDAQTEARFALVLMYNRERRYGDALGVLRLLQKQFPRNRLLWLEAGATALRAGKPEEAEAALSHGLASLESDRRPRMFGEEALWHYKRGVARVALRKAQLAAEDLRAALELDGRQWVRGRAHIELGKISDLVGDRAKARAEYDAAIPLCSRENDSECLEQVSRLKEVAYK